MSATFNEIEVRFVFIKGDEHREENDTFDCADSSLQTTIEDRRDEIADALNVDLEDSDEEWVEDGFEVVDFDDEFADPANFADLDDYGEYAELTEKHGHAFHHYYDNTGNCSESSFEDAYSGCWASFEEYAEQLIDDCYDIPDHLASYIDYEKWARDLSFDYFECEGSEGTYVFRNC